MYSSKRRFVYNVYVPGHCWFEAATQSYPPTAGVLSKFGAPLFRRVLSFGYTDLNVRGRISSCTGMSFMEHKDRGRQSNYSAASASTQDALSGVEELLPDSSEKSHWHNDIFDLMASSMSGTDCKVVTSDLWLHNILIDAVVLSLTLFAGHCL